MQRKRIETGCQNRWIYFVFDLKLQIHKETSGFKQISIKCFSVSELVLSVDKYGFSRSMAPPEQAFIIITQCQA